MKAQPIRLLDVLFLGPVMVAAGVRGGRLDQFTRAVLVAGGLATVVYNLRNFLLIQQGADDGNEETNG